jgi:hypothetical protein
LLEELSSEAAANGRTLSGHIRHLLVQHASARVMKRAKARELLHAAGAGAFSNAR